jgi:hypothetical protein
LSSTHRGILAVHNFFGIKTPVQLNQVLKSLSDDPSSSENGSAVAWKLTQQVDNGRMVSQTLPQNEDLPQLAVVSER